MKPLNEQIIKRLQKLAGISEIKVNAPTRVIFDILTDTRTQKQDLIRCIENGEPFFARMSVFVEPKTYSLNVRVDDSKPYNVTLIVTKVKEEEIPNLNPMYQQMAQKQVEHFNRLLKLLDTGGIPYKVKDGDMDGMSGENIYIFLDEKYINNTLCIDGVPFRDLN